LVIYVFRNNLIIKLTFYTQVQLKVVSNISLFMNYKNK